MWKVLSASDTCIITTECFAIDLILAGKSVVWLTGYKVTDRGYVNSPILTKITIRPANSLYPLAKSVVAKEAPPAILADALEEHREYWTEAERSELILAKLRECW